MADCPRKESNLKKCPCVDVHPGCPRQGICCLCIKYHRAMGKIPVCLEPVVEKIVERAKGETTETEKK